MPHLVLLRHGQSAWNLENRFTGWWDADLTAQGEAEARAAGQLIARAGLDLRQGFTSVQTRAIRTLWLALSEMNRVWLPIEKHWRLNERHYGGLTGLDKAAMAARHGEAQVRIWRRSYDIPPPPLPAGSAYDLSADPRYRGVEIPATESLKDTLARVLPYWHEKISAPLRGGDSVIIAAHGNSIRALMKHLFGIPDSEITSLEIPTGNPLLLDLSPDLVPVSAHYLDTARASSLPAPP